MTAVHLLLVPECARFCVMVFPPSITVVYSLLMQKHYSGSTPMSFAAAMKKWRISHEETFKYILSLLSNVKVGQSF